MKIHTNELGNIYLTPDDGFKYITNGETFSTEVYVPNESVISRWSDTNEEPDEPITDTEALNIVTGGVSNDTE